MCLYQEVMQTSEDPNLIPSLTGEGVYSTLARNCHLSTGVLFFLEVCSILETVSVFWEKSGSASSKAKYIRMWHWHISKIMFNLRSLNNFKKFKWKVHILLN